MRNVIAGIIAVILWGSGALLYARFVARNRQINAYRDQAHKINCEIKEIRRTGDARAIESFFLKLSKKWPGVEEVQFPYSEFLTSEGRLDDAVKILQLLVKNLRKLEHEKEREAPRATARLVRTLHKANRDAEALRVAERAIRRPYASDDLLLAYAQIASDAGDEAEAVRRLEKAVKAYPTSIPAMTAYLDALRKWSPTAQLELVLKDAVRQFSRNEGFAVQYARIAHDKQDWSGAVERWEDVRKNFVFCEEAYLKGAVALRELGRSDEANAVLGEITFKNA